MSLLRLVTLGLAFAGWHAAAAYPQPMNLTSTTFARDPSMVYDAKSCYYYLFNTGGGVVRSPALDGPWTAFGRYLDNGCSIINHAGRCGPWAPDVHYLNDTYYMCYALSTSGSQNSTIGVATSPDLTNGSWVDHGEVFTTIQGKQPYNAIDPNLVDVNGSLLLDFGSYWNGIYQFPLTADGFKPQTHPPNLTHLSYNATGSHSEEGSFLYKPNGCDWWYLFISSGQCCGFSQASLPPPGDVYKVMVGRGKSPSGPFLDQDGTDMVDSGGTGVLESHDQIYAPGGESLFWDPKSQKDVIVYHYLPINNVTESNKRLGINYVDFSSGWPVLVA